MRKPSRKELTMPDIPNDRSQEAYERMGQSVAAFLDAWSGEKAGRVADRGAAISFDALGFAICRCVAVFWQRYPHADLDEVCRAVEMGLTRATDDWNEASQREGSDPK
jgi:hypothetical protein